MINPNFNPYDLLQDLQQRMHHLEQAHNRMARDYTQTQRDLDVALDVIQTLQKSQISLVEFVNSAMEIDQILKEHK